MHVRKESGGTTITHRRVQYEWPEDGSVIEVPPEFGADLLGIRGGGFSEAPAPERSKAVTEPGPDGEITEPGPVAEVTEDGGSQAPGEGGATDPDGDGGTGPESDGTISYGEGGAQPVDAKARKGRGAKAEDTGTPA
jgi:hypothetical protein